MKIRKQYIIDLMHFQPFLWFVGCKRGNKCYKMGQTIEDEDNGCIKYRCTEDEMFTTVEFGMSADWYIMFAGYLN